MKIPKPCQYYYNGTCDHANMDRDCQDAYNTECKGYKAEENEDCKILEADVAKYKGTSQELRKIIENWKAQVKKSFFGDSEEWNKLVKEMEGK